MTDREAMQQALEALEKIADEVFSPYDNELGKVIIALRERLAQPEQEPFAYAYTGIKENGEHHGPHLIWGPEYMDAMSASMGATAVPLYTAPQPAPTIDKSAAIRIATALGWVPPSDTSQEPVDEAAKQRQEQEPVAKWDASAPLIVHPHPAFQSTLQPSKPWVGLTAAEFRKAVDGLEDLEDCWAALEHALKEKNT